MANGTNQQTLVGRSHLHGQVPDVDLGTSSADAASAGTGPKWKTGWASNRSICGPSLISPFSQATQATQTDSHTHTHTPNRPKGIERGRDTKYKAKRE